MGFGQGFGDHGTGLGEIGLGKMAAMVEALRLCGNKKDGTYDQSAEALDFTCQSILTSCQRLVVRE